MKTASQDQSVFMQGRASEIQIRGWRDLTGAHDYSQAEAGLRPKPLIALCFPLA